MNTSLQCFSEASREACRFDSNQDAVLPDPIRSATANLCDLLQRMFLWLFAVLVFCSEGSRVVEIDDWKMSANPSQFSFLFSGTPQGRPLSAEDRLPPRSRSADPESSKRAAADVERTGVMRGQRVLAQQLVESYPGSTSKELAAAGILDRYQLARRLPELVKLGLVRTRQTGNEDLRWFPND